MSKFGVKLLVFDRHLAQSNWIEFDKNKNTNKMKDMKNCFAGVDQSADVLNRLLKQIVNFGSSNPKKAFRGREKGKELKKK